MDVTQPEAVAAIEIKPTVNQFENRSRVVTFAPEPKRAIPPYTSKYKCYGINLWIIIAAIGIWTLLEFFGLIVLWW